MKVDAYTNLIQTIYISFILCIDYIQYIDQKSWLFTIITNEPQYFILPMITFWSFIGSKTMIITTVFISLNIEYTGARYTCTYVSTGMHEKSKSLNVPESYCWAIRHITNSTFKISVNYKWGRHMNSIILSDWTDRNWRVQKTKYTYFSSDSKPCLFIKMCTLYVICLDFSKTITIGFFFFYLRDEFEMERVRMFRILTCLQYMYVHSIWED